MHLTRSSWTHDHRFVMRFTNAFLLSSALVLLCSCDLIDHPPSDVYERISGTYEATTYVEVGPADGAIDILEAGGSLEMRLGEDQELKGHVVIPANTLHQSRVDTTFSGSYSVTGDTVHFDTGYYRPSLFGKAEWKPEEEKIESFDQEGLARAFKIILVRKE